MSSRWIADPSRQLTSARLCRAAILRHRRVPRVMAPPVASESHRHREGRHLGRRCRQALADPSHAATSASGNDIPDNTDSLVFPGFAYRPSATVRRLSKPAFLHAIVRQGSTQLRGRFTYTHSHVSVPIRLRKGDRGRQRVIGLGTLATAQCAELTLSPWSPSLPLNCFWPS